MHEPSSALGCPHEPVHILTTHSSNVHFYTAGSSVFYDTIFKEISSHLSFTDLPKMKIKWNNDLEVIFLHRSLPKTVIQCWLETVTRNNKSTTSTSVDTKSTQQWKISPVKKAEALKSLWQKELRVISLDETIIWQIMLGIEGMVCFILASSSPQT
jgi:hypothetical protein